MYVSKGDKAKSIQLVKDYFIEHHIALRNELASATNLSPATITTILQELQEANFIKQVGDVQSTGGRKPKCYKLCRNYAMFGLLSLQVNQTQTIASFKISDLSGKQITHQHFYFTSMTIEDICTCVKEMYSQYPFVYLSISVPAVVGGDIVTKSDIEKIEGLSLKTHIENIIDIPITIENDTHVALLGYLYQQAMSDCSIAFIYQPERYDSGCSLYVNHNIVHGFTHFAGELAYLPSTTNKEYTDTLCNQIASIIAIINPSHMVIYAPKAKQQRVIAQLSIPKEHHPTFIFIDTMEDLIFKGLTQLCIKNTRFKI